MKKLLVCTFLLGLTFMSCKKDKDKTCAVSEQNMVGSYKVTSIKYKASASAPEIESLSTFLDPCEQDDVLSLLANKTYLYKDAGTKCNPVGDYDGDWSISGNTLTVDGDQVNFDSFSCSGFKISIQDYNMNGDKASITYTKQ